jgi:hypothetical protein
VVGDFAPDHGLGELSQDRELIAEVAVEGFEPVGQGDDRIARRVCNHVAVVDVHHIGRLHERVIEVLVRRIKRIVNLERTAILGEAAFNLYVADKFPCEDAAIGDHGIWAFSDHADTFRRRVNALQSDRVCC